MRSRNIKPGFFKNEVLASMQPLTRLLFQGLWCMADSEGKLEDRPLRIKTEVLPYDNCDVESMLEELASAGKIIRYEVKGIKCITIPTFKEHQNPHPKEKKFGLPEPLHGKKFNSKSSNEKKQTSREKQQTSPVDSLLLNPDILNPESPLPESRPRDGVKAIAQEVFEYWQKELGHPKAILDAKREKSILARLKEGYAPDRIKQAVRGIKRSPHHMGDNDRKTVYDDIELICREGKNVDQLADLEENQGRAQNLNTKSSGDEFLEIRKQQREKEAGNA